MRASVHKHWLNAYEPGVPAEIGKLSYSSVGDYLHDCCLRFLDKPALSNYGVQLSYSEFNRYSRWFAAYLQNTLKLSKGDRLAVMLPNSLQYPVVIMGALKAGLVVVNFNPFYTSREIHEQLKDCAATTIIVFAGCANAVERAVEGTAIEHVLVTQLGDLFPWPKSVAINLAAKYLKRSVPEWRIEGAISLKTAFQCRTDFKRVPITHEDLAFLQYTGGTTGTAKGAMLSHGNLLANIEQTNLWLRQTLREGQERVIIALPLYHIFALTLNFLSLLRFGGIQYLITDPRDSDALVSELEQAKFTCIAGVNALFAKLLDNERFATLDFTDLRFVVGGGASIQKSVAEKWQQITGLPVCQAYGLTEASPGVCCNPLNLREYNGTVGVPVPSTMVQICSEKGTAVNIGEEGELLVKGPQVMQGYWGKETETANVLTKDGWLRTGDIATINQDGFVSIVDRQKDLIIVSGFNVYPNEIEQILVAHPKIADAGVVGEAHMVSGEIVKAFIVRNDPHLSAEMIETYCRENMTSYKVPDAIVFLDEIPKSKVGKVLRRQLREM